MDGLLKVTPEKLISSSEEFGNTGNVMNQLTGRMMEIVMGMKTVWLGDAATAYNNRFGMLQGDMDKLFRMVDEHSKDLAEMARNYQEAESANADRGQSLESGVVV